MLGVLFALVGAIKTEQRCRNLRSEGDLLRQELVGAAPAALREVARRVGVTRPLCTCTSRARKRWSKPWSGVGSGNDCATRLPTCPRCRGCLTYLRFAAYAPGLYAVLLGGRSAMSFDGEDQSGRPTFDELVRGVAGFRRGAPGDPHAVAVLLWIGLQGAATPSRPGRPRRPSSTTSWRGLWGCAAGESPVKTSSKKFWAWCRSGGGLFDAWM
jgi:hypothetical protein